GYGWVGIYEGWGNAPLTWAYNAAEGKPGCIFFASPKSMPIFQSPFPLNTAGYVHATGFDFAKSPYKTLNVQDFGQVGSTTAMIVDNQGRDRDGMNFIDGHDGQDLIMPRKTPVVAAANGTVVMA